MTHISLPDLSTLLHLLLVYLSYDLVSITDPSEVKYILCSGNGFFNDSFKVYMSLQITTFGESIDITVTKALMNEFRELKISWPIDALFHSYSCTELFTVEFSGFGEQNHAFIRHLESSFLYASLDEELV